MGYPENVIRCKMKWALPNGAEAYNVLHMIKQDGTDPDYAEVLDAAELLVIWWDVNNFKSQVNVRLRDWVSVHTTLVQVDSETCDVPPSIGAHVPWNQAGQISGDPLPVECAIVTTLYTATNSRRGRGRQYLPTAGVTVMDTDGTLDPVVTLGVNNTYEALRKGLRDHSDFFLAVHSIADGAARECVSTVTRDKVHHQRRRNQ